MALNPVMPDDASIETAEHAEGEPVVETPTPAPEPTPPDEPAPEPEPEPEPDDEAQKASEAGKELNARKRGLEGRKQTIQEQINALVRERGEVSRETERGRQEREHLQREIETLRGQRERVARGEPEPEGDRRPVAADPGDDPRDPKPLEAGYPDFAAFSEAIGRWGARQEIRRENMVRRQYAERDGRARWEAERQKNYSTRYQAFAKANATFEQEINREDLVLSEPVVDVIKDSELGPQLLLHLARHPEEIDRINAMRRPLDAYGEMKKLEARLELAHSGSTQPATHSKAPAPIKPVANATSRSSDGDEIPGEDVSDDEHFERMNKRDEMLRKRGINVRKGYGVRV